MTFFEKMTRALTVACASFGTLLAGCAEVQVASHVIKKSNAPVCSEEGALKVGNPYIVDGTRYYPIPSSYNYRERGIASWYGEDFHGKASANGECYNMYAFTAAHKTLPLPTMVRVTNLQNNRSIIVKVNDRGPFVSNRLIDLSYAAAQSLDMARQGTVPVLVEAVGGPHHHPDGAKGWQAAQAGRTSVLKAMQGPNDKVAVTLPTVVPGTVAEEELVAQVHAVPAQAAVVDTALVQNAPVMLVDGVRQTYVQVGAFSDRVLATGAMRRLKALDSTAALAPVTRADGVTLWRVRSGPYQNATEAESALARIRGEASQGFADAQIKLEQ